MTPRDTRPSNSPLLPIQDKEPSRQIMKAAFDSLQSSVFLVGPDHRIIFFNKAAQNASKVLYRKELFIGDSILKYCRKGDEEAFESFKNSFNQALLTRSLVIDKHIIHFPEIFVWIRTEFTPVFDGDKPVGVLLYARNISDTKKCEEKVISHEKLLDHIAWMQSHQTRQPLATIMGLINVLDKSSLSSENQLIITMLEETALKLEKVIQETVIATNFESPILLR